MLKNLQKIIAMLFLSNTFIFYLMLSSDLTGYIVKSIK